MVDRTVDINNMPVAYSPNEFFYQAVDQQMTPDKCAILDASAQSTYADEKSKDVIWANICQGVENTTDVDLLYKCYHHELCRNSDLLSKLTKTRVNHSGADGRYQDSKSMYNMEYLTLGNLSFGVIKLIVVILLIYYNK